MKLKPFSEIVEEIKKMNDKEVMNYVDGDDFEAWLKTRKQHYKNDGGHTDEYK